MSFNHLFIIDSPKYLNKALDTSMRIAGVLIAAGDKVCYSEINQLSIKSKGQAIASCKPMGLDPQAQLQFHENHDSEIWELGAFDVIHMRKDPPTDSTYWTTTLILDHVPTTTKIYNRPDSLRRFNEKLLIFDYPQYTNPGIVTAQKADMVSFGQLYKCSELILKPLDLFGGKGVIRVPLDETLDITRHIQRLEHALKDDAPGSFRMVQAFDQRIFDGEVRCFTARGVPIAWCNKIPRSGNFLANTSQGATLADYDPDPKVVEAVLHISEDLLEKGIFFVGFDIIGNKISEINITSPRLLSTKLTDTLFESVVKEIHHDLTS